MAYARSILFMTLLALTTVVLGIIASPAMLFGRRAARSVIRLWAILALWFLKTLCGISHRIEGAEHLPVGRAMLAGNHQSMWETIVVFTLVPRPAVVFKKELLDVPVYGWWGKRGGGFPIDRDGGARSIRVLKKNARARSQDGDQIVVFPEGTRSSVGQRQPLLPGVAAVYLSIDAPCTPFVHDSGRFWRHPGLLKTPGVITLRILPPIPAGLSRKEFMRRLEEAFDASRPDLIDAAAE